MLLPGSRGPLIANQDLMRLTVIALIALVLTLAPEKPKQDEEAKAPGNLSACLVWPDGNQSDVDLWNQVPGDKPVGYSNKNGKVIDLVRDDLGVTNDPMPANFECAYSRGLPAGEYVFGSHCYSCHWGPVEVSFTVLIHDAAGRLTRFDEKMTLAAGQERTLLRFRLDDKGNVVPNSVNHVFQPLRSAIK